MTPEEKWEADRLKSKQLNDVIQAVDQQVRRSVDYIHARLYWVKALEQIPPEVLVDALTMTLTGGRYQEVPRCTCCRRG